MSAMTSRWLTIPMLALGLVAGPAVFAQAPESDAAPAGPGTVNFVQGAVSIDGQSVSPKQIGNVTLDQGQELTTSNGRAEVLLTPGVFLRVDKNSAVKMVSPMLGETQVQLDKGKAGVEVDEIHHENNLQMIDAGVATRLEKTGYYEFNANHPEVMVFKGKADVEVPDTGGKEVKGNHEFLLANAEAGRPLTQEKEQKLKDDRSHDGLFNWSKLRSEYLAEANNQMSQEYAANSYPGWYWDPFMTGYTYMGGGPFYSPFGWGFAPFGWGGWGWGGGLGWGGGWYGGGWDGDDYRGGYGGRGFRGHERVGGFTHGGGFHGGGFHGGGGGFHGGSVHGGGAHR